MGNQKPICIYFNYTPDDTDIELRTVVIAMEFISQSGDHNIFDTIRRTMYRWMPQKL